MNVRQQGRGRNKEGRKMVEQGGKGGEGKGV